MATWYRVGWKCEIEPVEVVHENTKFLVVKRKFNPNSTMRTKFVVSMKAGQYFPTWREARDYLIDREHEKINDARRAIDEAEAILRAIEAMEEPK